MTLTSTDAVSLLVSGFPTLKPIIDEDELWASPHIAYGLLATELLGKEDSSLLNSAAAFIDELANSGDKLIEELLVIDILEGIAQDPKIARRLKTKIGSKSAAFLERVEREYFRRG